ncbi:hypothetical protein PR202_ga05283 [Eleusine coracana subsp. coracana]|uniref:Uncharacterized protein n=1 Tax=Eleusine coracana subsp. coracana TaxID=191504 RepID=A0AAV5BT40_ELECO|nr:hypothetical protein PR202_ga04830 [Eleusine coracana subsp. coracana]GJM89132.1 hypothetical protein PR202_ga05283 [Eleusine coracana subsp. coracana]
MAGSGAGAAPSLSLAGRVQRGTTWKGGPAPARLLSLPISTKLPSPPASPSPWAPSSLPAGLSLHSPRAQQQGGGAAGRLGRAAAAAWWRHGGSGHGAAPSLSPTGRVQRGTAWRNGPAPVRLLSLPHFSGGRIQWPGRVAWRGATGWSAASADTAANRQHGVIAKGLGKSKQNSGAFQELQAAADTACFGELEKALIHGSRTALDPSMIGSDVQTTAAGYLAARPPTLEIFPSWPMSHLQQPYSGNSQSVGSTSGSSSGQNTIPQAELVSPLSTRADSGHQQEALMVTVDDYNYGQGFGATAGTAPIFQPHTAGQDKMKHGSTRKEGKLLDDKV